ncbi:MAG: amidohydrolase [Actinobacteria bacterium]|nr:amidohydrolase [Actinomycetota bacterium]
MKFFDINFLISGSLYSREEKESCAVRIKKIIEDNDISNLIITNKLALDYDWNIGNEELLNSSLCSKINGLYYSYILTPDVYFTYDFNKYVNKAFEDGVRLFRFFPKHHLFYVNDYYMKRIFGLLSKKKFPVMLDLKELDITGNKYFDINVLEKILDENKEMPVILETSLKQCMFNRYYFPLLEKFNNLYLEISGMILIDQIEGYVEKFGSKRLIFGTDYPDLATELSVNRILLSEMNESDKENIAFNNIDNILRGIEIG